MGRMRGNCIGEFISASPSVKGTPYHGFSVILVSRTRRSKHNARYRCKHLVLVCKFRKFNFEKFRPSFSLEL